MNDKTEIILAMSIAFLAIPFYFIALFVVNFYNMIIHIVVESTGLPDKIYYLTKKKQRDRKIL
jgi:hypothetical protein